MTATRRITINLPLAPTLFLSPKRPFERSLGWTPSGLRYYYLARNAIWHGVESIGLKPGDTILMPSYNQGVEVEALLGRGMKLRYYRVDEGLRIDLDHLRQQMGAGVAAVYVIHYFGFSQPIESLRAIASEHGIKLIEDCALSLFSRASSGPLGSFGDMSLFCLYKSLPVPHGGALVLNRPGAPLPPVACTPDWKSTVAYLAHRTLDAVELSWNPFGTHRLVPLARGMARGVKRAASANVVPIYAATFERELVDLGISRATQFILDRTDAGKVVHRRRANYQRLSRLLAPGVRQCYPELPEGTCPLTLPILVRDREPVYERLLAQGIETVTRWPRAHPDIPVDQFPDAAFLRRHVLEIPVHQGLGPAHIDTIAPKVNEIARWE